MSNEERATYARDLARYTSAIAKSIIAAGGFFSSYVCLPVILILISSDPILRYAVGSPFVWSNEVSTFTMILLAFAGFGNALIRGRHVRVTLIFNKLPWRTQNVLWVMISLCTVLYIGLLTYGVGRLAFSSFSINATTPTARLLFFPWQLLAALGLFTFLVTLVLFLVKRVAIASGSNNESQGTGGFEGYGF